MPWRAERRRGRAAVARTAFGGACSKTTQARAEQDDTQALAVAVADNIVVQSELKVLPVPIFGQVKPSSACLSAPCLPPLLSHVFGLCPRRQREHRAFVKQCPRPGGS